MSLPQNGSRKGCNDPSSPQLLECAYPQKYCPAKKVEMVQEYIVTYRLTPERLKEYLQQQFPQHEIIIKVRCLSPPLAFREADISLVPFESA